MTHLTSTRNSQPSTLLIRADATRQIGNGHVMRCLALAAEWQERGGHVIFLTHADNPAITVQIDLSGAERITLSTMHPHADDLLELLALLRARRPAWTVLDGYHFTPVYQEAVQQAMRELGGKTLVLDDTAHRPQYHADLLLNQNVYAESLNYSSGASPVFLRGTLYALLRPEFARWQIWQRVYPTTANNILVTLGGTDPDNVTLKMVLALASMRRDAFTIKIVSGPGNPHYAVLQQAIAKSGSNMELLCCPGNLIELMAWADIAVAATGTTALELAYMQVPTLGIVLVDNQRLSAAGMTDAGTMQNLGWHDTILPQTLVSNLKLLARNRNQRRAMGNAGRQLVDGNGARRIADAMQAMAE